MKTSWNLAVGITGLVLMLWAGPSWGQGTNPTVSDARRNVAGGTNALADNLNLTNGERNTAFGDQALQNNRTGSFNSAFGDMALQADSLFPPTRLGS